ncbi:GT-D fold domain-containing glycosyltransferase, partial [Vibrio lentus]
MPNNIFKLLKKKLTPNQKKLILDIRRRVKAYFVNVRSIDIERISNYEKIYPHVSSTKETLELILRNKASICRFGDAEFDICQFENKDDPYQKPSQELSERLQEILHHESKNNLLICIPPF